MRRAPATPRAARRFCPRRLLVAGKAQGGQYQAAKPGRPRERLHFGYAKLLNRNSFEFHVRVTSMGAVDVRSEAAVNFSEALFFYFALVGLAVLATAWIWI